MKKDEEIPVKEKKDRKKKGQDRSSGRFVALIILLVTIMLGVIFSFL